MPCDIVHTRARRGQELPLWCLTHWLTRQLLDVEVEASGTGRQCSTVQPKRGDSSSCTHSTAGPLPIVAGTFSFTPSRVSWYFHFLVGTSR